MKQKSIDITLLHNLIHDRVITRKPIGIPQIKKAITNELIDDPGAKFRSVDLESEKLEKAFALAVIAYVAHCVAMRALDGDIPAPVLNVFTKYEKKNRKFTMYDCIDILQAEIITELAVKRKLINPLGDEAYQ